MRTMFPAGSCRGYVQRLGVFAVHLVTRLSQLQLCQVDTHDAEVRWRFRILLSCDDASNCVEKARSLGKTPEMSTSGYAIPTSAPYS